MATQDKKLKFYILTTYGECLDVAMQLQYEGHEVVVSITSDYKKIGENIVKHDDKWWNYTDGSWIFFVDGCENAELQDYLRSCNVPVFGSSKMAAQAEEDRQMGQKIFKAAGFNQPESKNFKSIDEALAFVKHNKDKFWVLKQNSNSPKSLNYIGKLAGSVDMLFHLEELKKKWNEAEYGAFDADLMEKVVGMELAVSVFFNGTEFMKNKQGKIVGYANFEEKKTLNDGLGSTCGEQGTTFLGIDDSDQLFKDVILKPKILEFLKLSKMRGVVDINCIKTKEGIVALEFTNRPGIPASSYEFIEGLNMPTSELIEAVATGSNKPVEIHKGVGMVMVLSVPPFPTEASIEESATSLGERLWILKDGKPVNDMDEDQRKHIHLENIYKHEDGTWRIASKNGYALTVTGRGKTISETRDALIQYTKDNIHISDLGYRTDIGARVEEFNGLSSKQKIEKEYQRKLEELKTQQQEELGKLKKTIKDIIYE